MIRDSGLLFLGHPVYIYIYIALLRVLVRRTSFARWSFSNGAPHGTCNLLLGTALLNCDCNLLYICKENNTGTCQQKLAW